MASSRPGHYGKTVRHAKEHPNNVYYTPASAVDYVYDKIKGFPRVWEPCCGHNHITRYLEAKGHRVIATDITMGEGYDIFTYQPPEDAYDIIVTNIPFQGKRKFLERLYSFNKPFAVLMPTVALDSNPIRGLFKQHGKFGIVFPDRKIDFIPGDQPDALAPPKGSRSFFHSSWYCYDVPGVEGMVFT